MKSLSRKESNWFKLDFMMPLQKTETKNLEKRPIKKRSSIAAIPAPDLKLILSKPIEKKKEEPEDKSENLCSSLCSSFKFVVNYGIFEQNFEWLPCEVKLNKIKVKCHELCELQKTGKKFCNFKFFKPSH